MVSKELISKSLDDAIVKCMSPKNSLIKGRPTITKGVDNNHKPIKIYKFDDIELHFPLDEEITVSYSEIKQHIQSLPKIFEEIKNYDPKLKVIKFDSRHWGMEHEAGHLSPTGESIVIYNYSKNKSDVLDTFTHELSHCLDKAFDFEPRFSAPSVYENVFKSDNKLYATVNPVTNRLNTPKIYPTENARIQFNVQNKDSFTRNWKFREDFADSSMMFLNPVTHDSFVEKYPNRAEYLNGIYGDWRFSKSSPLYQSLINEGKINGQ